MKEVHKAAEAQIKGIENSLDMQQQVLLKNFSQKQSTFVPVNRGFNLRSDANNNALDSPASVKRRSTRENLNSRQEKSKSLNLDIETKTREFKMDDKKSQHLVLGLSTKDRKAILLLWSYLAFYFKFENQKR